MSWPPPARPGTKLPPQSRLRAATRSPAPGWAAAVLFVVSAVCLAQSAASEPAKAASSSDAQGTSDPAAFAGSEACSTCHEDISKAFSKSAHGRISLRKEWADKACESCHGAAGKHAESASPDDVRNPLKLSPAEVDKTCLNCHRNEKTSTGRIRGGHFRNQVACTSCHTVHKGPQDLVKRAPAQQNAQCASCHTQVWARFQRPHAHRLPQGAMKCSDCHNPHGGFLPRQMQTVSANEPTCFRCHGDKRGPFAFEHAVVRMEGCSACHEPHGSANPRMLTRHEVRYQCLECHANVGAATGTVGGLPPAIHDTRNPRFRNCTNCHVKVHGSQVNRALLR